LIREKEKMSFSVDESESTRADSIVFITLCVTIVFSALAYGAVHNWALVVFQLLAAFIIFCWATDAFVSRTFRFSKSLLQIPLLGLIIVGLIQIIPFGFLPETANIKGAVNTISLDPFSTKIVLVRLFGLFVFFAAVLAFVNTPHRLRLVTYLILFFGLGLVFLAIAQSAISPTHIYGIFRPQSDFPFGPFTNRHIFASYMEMTIAIPLGLLFSGAVEREKRIFYVIVTGLMGVALLMSGSRGGFVSLIAEIFFLIVLSAFTSERAGNLLIRLGAGAALLAGIIIVVIFIGGESSLTKFEEASNIKDPTGNRINSWTIILDVIRERPVIGAGLGAFGTAYTPHDPQNGTMRLEQTHNDYLQVLTDAGLIGGALGLFFLFTLFYTALKRQRQTHDIFRRGVSVGAIAGCVGVLVHSFFDFTLHVTANAVLFLTLAALATINGRVEDVYEVD